MSRLWYRTCRGITNHNLTITEARFFWRVRWTLKCTTKGCGFKMTEPSNPHFMRLRIWWENSIALNIRCFLKEHFPFLRKYSWVFTGIGIVALLFSAILFMMVVALISAGKFF